MDSSFLAPFLSLNIVLLKINCEVHKEQKLSPRSLKMTFPPPLSFRRSCFFLSRNNISIQYMFHIPSFGFYSEISFHLLFSSLQTQAFKFSLSLAFFLQSRAHSALFFFKRRATFRPHLPGHHPIASGFITYSLLCLSHFN